MKLKQIVGLIYYNNIPKQSSQFNSLRLYRYNMNCSCFYSLCSHSHSCFHSNNILLSFFIVVVIVDDVHPFVRLFIRRPFGRSLVCCGWLCTSIKVYRFLLVVIVVVVAALRDKCDMDQVVGRSVAFRRLFYHIPVVVVQWTDGPWIRSSFMSFASAACGGWQFSNWTTGAGAFLGINEVHSVGICIFAYHRRHSTVSPLSTWGFGWCSARLSWHGMVPVRPCIMFHKKS